jgi:LacI family transcriptional regulator
MGYRPNAAARSMRTAKMNHIGIIMSGSYAAPYEHPVIMGISEVLHDAGYAISIVSTAETGSRPATEALVLREQFLAGAFVMHVPDEVGAHVRSILDHCIDIDSNIRGREGCIYRDEVHAGRLAARNMIDLGYPKLVMVCHKPHPGAHIHMIDRPRGVREAARASGAALEMIELGFEPEDYRAGARRLLGMLSRKTAVIAGGEDLAEWCSHSSTYEGLCPGRDYALSSCAETMRSTRFWPGLSRVGFDRIGLGRRAAEMMLDLVTGKKKHVPSVKIRGEWIPGDTAPPRR